MYDNAKGFTNFAAPGADRYKIATSLVKQPLSLASRATDSYIALATMILGAQFFIAGFLAELILKFNLNKDKYSIKNKTF